jgi:hypothetical protein
MKNAPSSIVGLADESAAAIVGNKFAGLAAVGSRATVPPAYCIPADWFEKALGGERMSRLDELFDDFAATLGHEISTAAPRIASALHGLALDDKMREEMADAVVRLRADGPASGVAVRSSTTVEDGDEHSHAGLYESYLNLREIEDVEAAVLSCWKSFYAPRAVLGRIRVGDLSPQPRMAVIIQRMVDAQMAGVAITQPERIVIDATHGTGEALVSGLADAVHRELEPGPDDVEAPFDAVGRLAVALRADLGFDVDIEWAYDGDTVFLLQARPVTAALGRPQADGPLFAHAQLYFDDTIPPDLPLGECAELYLAYTAKRAPLYRLAAHSGIRVGAGWVVALNGAALADDGRQPEWWRKLDGTVVLDLGANLRQHIMPASELNKFLADALNITADARSVHTLIIREFVQGDAGVLSHRTASGETIVEYAAQGLLAMNRGLTDPSRLTIPLDYEETRDVPLVLPRGWTDDTATRIAAFTRILNDQFPGGYAEWVLVDGVPRFVDVSVPDHDAQITSSTGTLLSPGTAQGPLLVLEDSDDLLRLSVAPIVGVNFRADAPESAFVRDLTDRIRALPAKPVLWARRPYVILSLVIDDVAGFVFSGGSTLCHLAILLREARRPGVITSRDLGAANGKNVVLADGAIHIG